MFMKMNTITERRKIKSISINLLFLIVIPVLMVLILTRFIVMPLRIDGISMYPSIEGGTMVWVSMLPQEYYYGDIILFIPTEGAYSGTPVVKRVIGEPNQIVIIEGNSVYINGVLLAEDYAVYDNNSEFETVEYIVPDNCYFVLGDNRCHSIDSRYNDIGFVSESCIVGKVVP